MVAAIDGMRFVVPVPSLMAKPNRKYFGPKRGMTFLNMINDQALGTGHKIVAGTDRGCLHTIDLFFSPGAANLPEVLVTDTGSYSDLIFGIASLLGVDYRPALADLPDQIGWRPGDGADYGSLNTPPPTLPRWRACGCGQASRRESHHDRRHRTPALQTGTQAP